MVCYVRSMFVQMLIVCFPAVIVLTSSPLVQPSFSLRSLVSISSGYGSQCPSNGLSRPGTATTEIIASSQFFSGQV